MPTAFPADLALACTTHQTELGEGARWDARRQELLRVDILAGVVFRDRVAADGSLEPLAAHGLLDTVGAVAPVEGDDGWIVAAGRGFVHLRPDGTHRTVLEVAPEGVRMNDAACDPQGRLWAGTVAHDARPGAGSLYRLDADGSVEVVLDGLHISNGLGWSPDGETLYLADSGARKVHAFRFDPAGGTLSEARSLVLLPEEVGVPDGLTVDAAGHVWVAVYGGGCVHRYAPDGTLLEIHRVPADQSTSCAFGGPALDWLYVTTATEHWSEEDRLADPGAGVVYRLRTGAVGVPASPFRPDPSWWSVVRA
jgi:sugar lactone lactonase YvrE